VILIDGGSPIGRPIGDILAGPTSRSTSERNPAVVYGAKL
jgi:hypothetical protein